MDLCPWYGASCRAALGVDGALHVSLRACNQESRTCPAAPPLIDLAANFAAAAAAAVAAAAAAAVAAAADAAADAGADGANLALDLASADLALDPGALNSPTVEGAFDVPAVLVSSSATLAVAEGDVAI